ncbi:TadE family type IV pilus minor pilin [Nocardioides sp. YIM 152588]|uniref:TadE family type IV pilus minor pilin n=1 Tax=Nocardioides sp. YIM 152588 TaxID=3158259 RepID=UPI0032E3F408
MTAELVVGLPVLCAVTLALVWLLSVGAAQVRTVDAAREAARALARGDDPAAAVAIGQRVAPAGVRVAVAAEGDRVVARASGVVPGPGGLLRFLPGARVRAEAVALSEAPAAGTPP